MVVICDLLVKEMLDTKPFERNFSNIINRKEAALYALSLKYAAEALNYFRQQQETGAFWENQTNQAMDGMIAEGIKESDVVGFFMAHTVEYGPYLELANNGQNEAIKPVLEHISRPFFEDVRKLINA